MKLEVPSLNLYGAGTVLSVLVAIFLVSITGAFRAADDFSYDLGLAVQPEQATSNDILLVYASESAFEDPGCQQLTQLSKSLFELGAERVGLIFEPDCEQTNVLAAHPYADRIVVGGMNSDEPDESLASEPPQTLLRGSLDLYLNQSVYRSHVALKSNSLKPNSLQPNSLQSGSINPDTAKPTLSVEAILAEPYLVSRSQIPTGPFGIRYAGGPNSLPHVTASDVLAGEVISEMIHQRIVLVGQIQEGSLGIITPTTRGPERMNRLEVRGNVLNTLLLQNQIKPVPAHTCWLLLLVVAIASSVLVRQLKANWIARSYLMQLALILVVCWGLQYLLSIQLPLTAMITTITLTLISNLYTRFRAIKDTMIALQVSRQSAIERRWKTYDKECWSMIADSVYQNFYPNRMVLFELKPGETHLSAAKTINCFDEEIFERRRDINREPFRSATERGVATQNATRHFFSDSPQTDRTEYFVPLLLVSELIGFMVLEMSNEQVDNWDNFENFVTQFAGEMAMMANNDRMRDQSSQKSKILTSIRNLPEQLEKERLQKDESDYQQSIEMLANSFEQSKVATAVYDAFGRLIRGNTEMNVLIRDMELVIDDTNATDLLCAITGWPIKRCRKLFRETLIDGKTRKVFLPNDQNRSSHQMLFLEPLEQGTGSDLTSRCVSVQVIDGHLFQSSLQWQTDLSRSNSQQVLQQMTEFRKLSTQLRSAVDHRDFEQHKRLIARLTKQISQCQTILNSQFSQEPEAALLVDAATCWKNGLRHFNRQHRTTQVTERLEQTNLTAFANPMLLEQIFVTILECLKHEHAASSEILVSADSVDRHIVFRFTDMSGGDPIHELRKQLEVVTQSDADDEFVQESAVSLLTPAQLDSFREIENWLNIWGASLLIRCCANYRLNIELTLNFEAQKRFSLEANSETPAKEPQSEPLGDA